jgi:hypothetical protein
MRRQALYFFLVLLLLTGCNLPLANKSNPTQFTPISAVPTTQPSLSGPGVQIISPANGAQFNGDAPIQVQFVSAGGPFIEADLLDEIGSVDTLALPSDNTTPSGTLSWKAPISGTHTLTVEVLTADKQIYSATVHVTVTGGTPAATQPVQPTAINPALDPEREAIKAQVIKIFHDTYGLNLTAPPVMRKYRPGVPNDPWHSVVYIGNWMYDLAVYPDRVEENVFPLNMQSDGSVPIQAGQKTYPICRPAGTLKVLVALVDFQNLGVTKDQALSALDTVAQDMNTKFAEYSTAGGAKSPILQLQIKGVYLSPPPTMPDHLLTPAIVKAVSGEDPANYDLLVQIDLDGNNTYRKVLAARNFETNGEMLSPCLGQSLSIWMSLDTKDKALGVDTEKELERILSHEILHTFGYPADHSWPAGDGSLADPADDTDIFGWPTLMLGWTDTDGDGIPEIIDPTPYGRIAH